MNTHACQGVGMCSIKDESCTGKKTSKREIHPGFETKDRYHKKSKTLI